MAFSSIGEFLAMGGHGLYVWASYAIALVMVTINLTSPRLLRKKLVKDQARRLRREQQ